MDESLHPPSLLPLRVAVREVQAGQPRQVVRGEIVSGRVRVGETLVFSPHHRTGTLQELRDSRGIPRLEAGMGEKVSFSLREVVAVEPGQIASHETDGPIESNRCKLDLHWFGPVPLAVGERVRLVMATQQAEGEIVQLRRGGELEYLEAGESAQATLRLSGTLVMDNYERNPAFGQLALITAEGSGAGRVFGGYYTSRAQVKSRNISWSEGNVTEQHRALRNGHRGAVIWLTGLSGSGKSSLSRELERELFRMGLHVYVLDGDNMRHGLNADLGFSPQEREENIRRVAEVAKLLSHAGLITITAFISPYRADRRRAREIALEAGGEFIEVYVEAPLETCEQRDRKGLYQKARAGEISDFTGISAPYEAPLEPEVTVRTDQLSLAESGRRVIEFLYRRLRREAVDFEI